MSASRSTHTQFLISPLNSATINTPGGRRTNCSAIDRWKLSQSIHIWAHQRDMASLSTKRARCDCRMFSALFLWVVGILVLYVSHRRCRRKIPRTPLNGGWDMAHLGCDLQDNESYAWPGGPDAPRGTTGTSAGLNLLPSSQFLVLPRFPYSFIAARNNNSKHYTRSKSNLRTDVLPSWMRSETERRSINSQHCEGIQYQCLLRLEYKYRQLFI